jgi:hypothetical protein
MSLLIYVNDKIPFEFGLHCQVEAAGVFASYTMIPMDSRQKNIHLADPPHARNYSRSNSSDRSKAHLETPKKEEGTYLQFIIKKSILTEALKRRLRHDRNAYRVRDQRETLFGKVYRTLPIQEMGLVVSGPYHSTDMGIKDNSCEILVVMTKEAGISVAESVVKFSLCHSIWDKLIIIQSGGRYGPPTPQIVLSHRISDGREPLDLLCAFDSPNPDLRANEVWSHIFNKLDDENEKIFSYQLYGEITAEMMLDLVLKLENTRKKNVHYLICSETLFSKFEEADKLDQMDGELWSRIHNEVFQIQHVEVLLLLLVVLVGCLSNALT